MGCGCRGGIQPPQAETHAQRAVARKERLAEARRAGSTFAQRGYYWDGGNNTPPTETETPAETPA